MNSFLILTFFSLLSVGQVFSSSYQTTAGATSLQGSVKGGANNTDTNATRWIDFADVNNDWSMLGNTYTVEAWIWHNSGATSSWQPVLARHPGDGMPLQLAHFSIAVQANSNLQVTAGCGCDSKGQNCGNGFYLVANSASFSVQMWQHVAVTFNGDGVTPPGMATLYLNGQPISSIQWAATNSVCQGRSAQWATYADVTVGFVDDSASGTYGWTGMIDEIRLWESVRSATDIQNYMNVGLNGDEEGLMAYYQFSPSLSLLQNATAPKEITNGVSGVSSQLNGLPQPNPNDANVFVQSSSLQINIYSIVEGQNGDDPTLPLLPNDVQFDSWPYSNQTIYSVIPGYSPALQTLINSGLAQIYGNPQDLSEVTVFVDCPNNNCSTYTTNWKQYYFNYSAVTSSPSSPATVYLQIQTACPSGIYDSCGTCEGDNSLCQCVVYHGFETERMSYILLEWSLDQLISDIEAGTATLSKTLTTLDSVTPSNSVLEDQIYQLMGFYNGDLTTYCGELYAFMTDLQASIPSQPAAFIDASATPEPDSILPYIPGFVPPPGAL